jgi:DNA-binding XRE family transcriptional regulator
MTRLLPILDRLGDVGDADLGLTRQIRDRVAPTLPFLPKIIEFLGYCPYDPDWTPGERLTWIRKYLGMSQETMARRLGVDPGTLAKLEQGKRSVPEKVEKQFLMNC